MAARRLTLLLASALVLSVASPASAASGSITGRLLDEEGRPLAGMQVRTSCDGDEVVLVTGADGRYARTSGSADRCTVEARDPSGDRIARDRSMSSVPEQGSWGSVADVNPRGTALTLRDRQMFLPGEVVGRVVDAQSGAGVDGLSVRIQDATGPRESDFTRADGRFGPVSVWPGRYYVVVSVPFGDGRSDSIVVASTDPAASGTLVAPGGRLDVGTTRAVQAPRPLGRIAVSNSLTSIRAVPHPRAASAQLVTPSGVDGRYPGTYLVRHDNGTWFGGRSELTAKPVTVRAGQTTTVPAPGRTVTFDPEARDAAGNRVAGVFVAAHLADDPVEVIATAVTDHNGRADLAGVPADAKVVLTWTDLWGRYTTRSRVPFGDIDLGTSRNGLPADPSPPPSEPLPTGPLRVPAENRDGRQAPQFGFQVFAADDPSRPVAVGDSRDAALFLPPGSYRIRMIDPTRRWNATFLGGATTFDQAQVFRPWTEFPRDLPSARLQPALAALVLPTVVGRTRVGATVKADRGKWNGSPRSYSFRWFRNGKAIPKATSGSYRITKADVGRRLTVRVVARSSTGATRSATSLPVRPRS